MRSREKSAGEEAVRTRRGWGGVAYLYKEALHAGVGPCPGRDSGDMAESRGDDQNRSRRRRQQQEQQRQVPGIRSYLSRSTTNEKHGTSTSQS